MKNKYPVLLTFTILAIGIALSYWLSVYYAKNSARSSDEKKTNTSQSNNNGISDLIPSVIDNSLSIEQMRKQSYPGSKIIVEEELPSTDAYSQAVVSYQSEGLKIYALMTIPLGEKPATGWPAIIFNHGYIPPEQYSPKQRYESYIDGFASNGYIVFKPDYRGHGNSEGQPTGAYFSPGYTVDVLNALSSVKKHPLADQDRIGMWGHSMGGNITMRSMVIDNSIKAGVIWGGVVGSYKDMYEIWWSRRNRPTWTPSERERHATRPGRQSFTEKYNEPSDESAFWRAISPTFFIKDISGPVQLHHGLSDETVPWELSQRYADTLQNQRKDVELFLYEATDHNLLQSFNVSMQRSVQFFDTHVKGDGS